MEAMRVLKRWTELPGGTLRTAFSGAQISSFTWEWVNVYAYGYPEVRDMCLDEGAGDGAIALWGVQQLPDKSALLYCAAHTQALAMKCKSDTKWIHADLTRDAGDNAHELLGIATVAPDVAHGYRGTASRAPDVVMRTANGATVVSERHSVCQTSESHVVH